MGEYLADVVQMFGAGLALASQHGDAGGAQRRRDVVLGCARAAGDDELRAASAQDHAEDGGLRLDMDTHADGQPGEGLRALELVA